MKNIGLCWLISSLCICFSPYYRCFCFLFAFAVFYLFSLFYLLQKKIVYVFHTFFIYTLINFCSFVFAGFCCAIKKLLKSFAVCLFFWCFYFLEQNFSLRLLRTRCRITFNVECCIKTCNNAVTSDAKKYCRYFCQML